MARPKKGVSALASPGELRSAAAAGTPREAKLSATARAFAILEHIAQSTTPVDMLDIIGALNLPKATAYRLIEWFIDHGYVAREPERKRLMVGPRLTKMSIGVMIASMQNAQRHMVLRQLVNTVNETANIGTLFNGEIVYLDRVEAEHWPLRLQFGVGSHVPLHCSAIGKLFLALAHSRRRRGLVGSLGLERFTEHTITSKARLEEELDLIRKERVSFDRQEFLIGVVCAAVPVLEDNGELVAAVAIQAPEARMTVDSARRHLPALRHAATQLAATFGTRD